MTEDYVARAERVLSELKNKDNRIKVTSSQMRKFISAVNSISNQLAAEEARDPDRAGKDQLSPEIQSQIKYLKVLLVYQIGRAETKKGNPLKEFAVKAGLEKEIDGIGSSKKKFRDFARYLEALVAYHKYYGGE